MNRRALISAVGTAIFAGCISTGNQGTKNQGTKGNKLIVNTEPVTPGQTGTIIIRTTKTEYVSTGGELVDTPISIDYDNATFSSQPNVTQESYPPNWRWFSARNLTEEVNLDGLHQCIPFLLGCSWIYSWGTPAGNQRANFLSFYQRPQFLSEKVFTYS